METIRFKVRMTRCKTPCPHGMTYATVPIRPDLQGVHYDLVRKQKNGIVMVGSWCCMSCLHWIETNGVKSTIVCDYQKGEEQLKLFKI